MDETIKTVTETFDLTPPRLCLSLHLVRDSGLRDRLLRSILASPLEHGEETTGELGAVVMWISAPLSRLEEMREVLLDMGLPPSLIDLRR